MAAPKKSPRKRTPKKEVVDGEPTTPKKRGRPAKSKKVVEEEQESGSYFTGLTNCSTLTGSRRSHQEGR